MNKPDSVLVEMALKQDRAAFRLIVERTQGMVYKIAYRFLQSAHDAEDATQEVYIRLWKNLSGYKPGVKLTTWLYRITVNYCLDKLKSREFKHARHAVQVDNITIHQSPAADRQLVNAQFNDLVMQATEKLTPVQKAVFVLRDLETLSTEETAGILDMTPDNVKSNLYHARKRISGLLSPFKNELL